MRDLFCLARLWLLTALINGVIWVLTVAVSAYASVGNRRFIWLGFEPAEGRWE